MGGPGIGGRAWAAGPSRGGQARGRVRERPRQPFGYFLPPMSSLQMSG
jgi:hypothetical protein